MAFRIAHAVFALTVVLIARFVQDVGARSSSALVMGVDVRYMDDEPAARRPTLCRRNEVVRLVRAVEPDPMGARPDLAVNDRAVRRALKSRRCKTEHADEEIVLRCDIRTCKKAG